jgi:hypothetical protein
MKILKITRVQVNPDGTSDVWVVINANKEEVVAIDE